MESCSFIRPDTGRCGSKFNCKEVEFRHPEYKDLCELVFLCQSHFFAVFGEPVAKKDSILPLEEEKWLELQVRNEDSRYRKKLGETRNLVKDGIGTDHFDWGTFDASNKRILEDLRSRLKHLRRSQCRFEWCRKKIENFKHVYTVRVYPKSQIDYVNLIFCSLDHWEVYKKRIGLIGLRGNLDETRTKPTSTLDEFTPKKVEVEI